LVIRSKHGKKTGKFYYASDLDGIERNAPKGPAEKREAWIAERVALLEADAAEIAKAKEECGLAAIEVEYEAANGYADKIAWELVDRSTTHRRQSRAWPRCWPMQRSLCRTAPNGPIVVTMKIVLPRAGARTCMRLLLASCPPWRNRSKLTKRCRRPRLLLEVPRRAARHHRAAFCCTTATADNSCYQ
jgi:hypothetical protein